MRRVSHALLALVVLGTLLFVLVSWRARRALPNLEGTRPASGVGARVEILRDRWGVPHIYAQGDDDAYFGLGYCHAQDRLFQMEVLRHVGQGRLSELFGRSTIKADRLFRTLDLHGVGRRMLAAARPEARRGLEAYARGVNLAARHAKERGLPLEFTILGRDFEPVKPDDFLGVLGYMAWGLDMSWYFDPLVERIAARVGPERAAQLFPWNFGGLPAVHPGAPAPGSPSLPSGEAARAEAALDLFDLTPFEERLLSGLPPLRASNNWVLGPSRTTTGKPILANDPHLSHGLPSIWYEAHLVSPGLDAIGATLPGLPMIVIGHNRDVAWGLTNVMLDGGDFFLEKIEGDRVKSRGEWVLLEKRVEVIGIAGEPDERLEVRSTPHGPLVGHLRDDEERPLAFRWNYLAAGDANEIEGFYLLNRARDWQSFRDAVSRFGAIAQNAVYADRQGHIGLQTTGRIPRYSAPKLDGTRLRNGWDGSEDWDGFIPFEQNPSSFDPPQGWLASANNPTVSRSPYYISNQWEPVDRITRIHQMIAQRERHSVADVARMQSDTTLVQAQELVPLILEAHATQAPASGAGRAALDVIRAWNFDMDRERAAPVVFAYFHRRLYEAVFEDELGPELTKAFRSKANVWAIALRAALHGGAGSWLDRTDTPGSEDRAAIVRRAFADAVRDVVARFGDDPSSARWGDLHRLSFRHSLGRGSRLLGLYFDRGPFPVPGHTGTVNKMEYPFDDFGVTIGPSLRQITDLGELDRSLAVLPGGQSGLPASPHYDDLMQLWLRGEYHAFPMSRAAIEAVAARRLVLEP